MGYEWVEITLTLANFASFGASIVKKTRFGKTIPSPLFVGWVERFLTQRRCWVCGLNPTYESRNFSSKAKVLVKPTGFF
jgi:hypothetical protein